MRLVVRSLAASLLSLAACASAATTPSPSARIAGHVVAMGFVGPFLNTLCFYLALRSLAVGKVVVLRMAYVILIPVGAVVIYGQALSAREVAGGAAILLGCAMLIHARERRRD